MNQSEAGSTVDHQLVSRPPSDQREGSQYSNDRPEPRETGYVLTRYVDVHAPQTSDQVHRDEYGTERRELGEDVVDLVVRLRHFDGDLREVVRVRSGEYLLVVIQVLRHGNQVVLDIGEVQALKTCRVSALTPRA